MKSYAGIITRLSLAALILFSVAGCDEKDKKIRHILTGKWMLAEQLENGEKKDCNIKIEFMENGTAILVQYNKKNIEILRSEAKWKVDEEGNSITWYDDKNTADQTWTLISISPDDCVIETSVKYPGENWTIRRHLKKER